MNNKNEYEISANISMHNRIGAECINSAVVIPALNPIPDLIHFVHRLLEMGIPEVIVVNDGSDSSFDDVFSKLKQMKHCTVLTHKVNLGKGRALKTAFTYFIKNCSHLKGVVTADADGQHAAEDIYKICKMLSLNQSFLVLGVRNFREKNVPKRSYLGNTITSRIFQLLYGSYLNDTQTGLRGIPACELPWITTIKGERYDYEINMLIKARQRHIGFATVPVKTLYFDNNSGSHYGSVKDSALIFLCLIMGLIPYSGAAIISGIFDISIFSLLNSLVLSSLSAPVRIFASTAIARGISSICNFLLNRSLTFKHTGKLITSVARYYTLCISQMIASYGFVYTISLLWKINESIIKLIIDSILGCISYQIQLHWVFKNNDGSDEFFPTSTGHL